MSRKRIVVVTGGGSGIGRATAKRFAEDGDFVVVADINEEGAKAVAGEIADTGGNATHIAVDVADDSSVAALADTVENTHGPTDVLVTSAGVLQNVASIRNMDMDEHDRGWAVNYRGVYVCRREFGRRMAERGHGCIVPSNLAPEALRLQPVLVDRVEADDLVRLGAGRDVGADQEARRQVGRMGERHLGAHPARRAHNLHHLAPRALRRAEEARVTAAKLEHRGDEPIGAEARVPIEQRHRAHGFVVEDQAGDRRAVAAHVQQAAAPRGLLVADIPRVVGES